MMQNDYKQVKTEAIDQNYSNMNYISSNYKEETNINNESNSNTLSQEHNFNYYHEYCRLFIANIVLTNQMQQLATEQTELVSRLVKLEKKSEDLHEGYGDDEDRQKRFRRTASQIERHYQCPVEICQQSYGSEGSLNQHVKIKHPEYYNSKYLNLSCSQQISETISEDFQDK